MIELSLDEMRRLTVLVYMIRTPNLYLLSLSIVPEIVESTHAGEIVKLSTLLSYEAEYVIVFILRHIHFRIMTNGWIIAHHYT